MGKKGEKMKESVAFIGCGVMGTPMALRLLEGGFPVFVHTRTMAKAEKLLQKGARWRDSIPACVEGRSVVITMVGYPRDVEEIYLGRDGILENVAPGTVVIDMTTSSPGLAERIFCKAKERGVSALDAPVSGGDVGAKTGALSIMVGGEKDAFERCLPLFQVLGQKILYEGKAGSGQHTKLANQIAIAGAISGVCEAIAYGKAAGLDLELMLDSISQGAAGSWQMTNLGPKILEGDFSPGFFIKHFVKDMRLAAEEAEHHGLLLEMLPQVLKIYEELEKNGKGEWGTQGLINRYHV